MIKLEVLLGLPAGNGFLGSMTGRLESAGGFDFPLEIEGALAPVGQKLVQRSVLARINGQPLLSYSMIFDPPSTAVGDWWEELKSGVEWGARATGSVAMWAIGGIGCIGTSVGGCALGGITSVASLGTATLSGIVVAAGGVIACGALTEGAGWVVEQIWAQ